MSVQDKLAKQGPRKLLAVDGGGIRGLLAIEILAAVEDLLRNELKRGAEFRLADYFDYVAGTSTGAVVATCVALRMKVSEIRDFYVTNGAEMFDRVRLWQLWKRFSYKFMGDRLKAQLQDVLGLHTPLGSARLDIARSRRLSREEV